VATDICSTSALVSASSEGSHVGGSASVDWLDARHGWQPKSVPVAGMQLSFRDAATTAALSVYRPSAVPAKCVVGGLTKSTVECGLLATKPSSIVIKAFASVAYAVRL